MKNPTENGKCEDSPGRVREEGGVRKYDPPAENARAVQPKASQGNLTGPHAGPLWLYLTDERKIAARDDAGESW